MSGAMKAMVMTGYFGSECDGGFSEYTIIDARNVAAVHNPVGDAEPATFSCSHTTAEGMLSRADVGPDDTVLVTGASGLGVAPDEDMLGAPGAVYEA